MARPKGDQEPRPGGKLSTSFRLHEETLERIRRTADRLHITQSAVIEQAVRQFAKREGVE